MGTSSANVQGIGRDAMYWQTYIIFIRLEGYTLKQLTLSRRPHLPIQCLYQPKPEARARTCAGVERVFSAAGRMHNDLRKSMKNDTLSHSLFAAFNTL